MHFKNNEGMTPIIRTVENSQIGDGLRHDADQEEEVVVFDDQQ